MFTGIISSTAKVVKAHSDNNGMILVINKPPKWKVKIGDSIAINGVCSTVKKVDADLLFEYMPETLHRSCLAKLKIKDAVNLEQSLRVNDRLDGHIVQGHVDCAGKIKSIAPQGNSFVFTIIPPAKFMKFLAEKGSVAVDGISLTIANSYKNNFSVKIIPYTLKYTNLGLIKVGGYVNIECDVLAKYMFQMGKYTRYRN